MELRGIGRSALLMAAAAVWAVGAAFAAEPSFGTFTDARDWKTYKTVKIGRQTWMAQNLNYKKGKSWCYDKDKSNCDKYGRLYDWKTARKACPAGYHLPSRHEWKVLVAVAGGDTTGADTVVWKKLRTRSGWDGDDKATDDYGFSAVAGGFRSPNGSFNYASSYGIWWTATEDTEYTKDLAIRYGIYYDIVDDVNSGKSAGYSVRCVAND